MRDQTPPPVGGNCETEDGGFNEVFTTDGLRGHGVRKRSAEAVAICQTCPVLAECRQWAAQFDNWSAVTIAGWTAKNAEGESPPWAPKRRKQPAVRIEREGEAMTRLACTICGTPLTYRGFGRPPSLCPSCRAERAKARRTEYETRAQRMKGGIRP